MGTADASMCWVCMVGCIDDDTSRCCSSLPALCVVLQLLGQGLGSAGLVEPWKVGRRLISSLSFVSASFTLFVMSNRSGASCHRWRSCVACTVRPRGKSVTNSCDEGGEDLGR